MQQDKRRETREENLKNLHSSVLILLEGGRGEKFHPPWMTLPAASRR